jgi:hypothetical protein
MQLLNTQFSPMASVLPLRPLYAQMPPQQPNLDLLRDQVPPTKAVGKFGLTHRSVQKWTLYN